jgi:GGDEF domain-containing protein
MSLITLKRFLKSDAEEAQPWRMIWLLLEGIALHTVPGDTDDYDLFRSKISSLQAIIEKDPAAQYLPVLVGQAIQIMVDYGQQTSRFFQQQMAVLRNIVSVISETTVNVAGGSEQAAARLCEIQQRLSAAIRIDEVHALRTRLDECLKELREEAARQKSEAEVQAREIKEQLHRATAQLAAMAQGDTLDPNTGLPSESPARAAFRKAASEGGNKYLIIAVANRLQSVNLRFGRTAGDQVLKAIAEFLSSKLTPADRIFRWRGPTLVALLERGHGLAGVRAELNRFSQGHIEQILIVEGRRVMVPLNVSWLVMPLSSNIDNLMSAIDKFVASQSQETPPSPKQ